MALRPKGGRCELSGTRAANTWAERQLRSLQEGRDHVIGFEDFLQSNTDRIDPELLAAKMCGRWRNGVPRPCHQTRIAPREGSHLSS